MAEVDFVTHFNSIKVQLELNTELAKSLLSYFNSIKVQLELAFLIQMKMII